MCTPASEQIWRRIKGESQRGAWKCGLCDHPRGVCDTCGDERWPLVGIVGSLPEGEQKLDCNPPVLFSHMSTPAPL